MSISTIAARFAGVSLAAALLLGPGVAWAGANFIKVSGSIDAATGDYTASWKEAGLGNCSPTGECTYTLSANATFMWQCYNNGSNVPQGSPQTVNDTHDTVTGSFPPTHNGNISASLTITPDATGLNCKGGARLLCLASADYSGVMLTDTTTNDATASGELPNLSAASFPVPSKKNPAPSTCIPQG